MVLTHSDRCKRGASLIEREMRKHSDHETESDEANDMSCLSYDVKMRKVCRSTCRSLDKIGKKELRYLRNGNQ